MSACRPGAVPPRERNASASRRPSLILQRLGPPKIYSPDLRRSTPPIADRCRARARVRCSRRSWWPKAAPPPRRAAGLMPRSALRAHGREQRRLGGTARTGDRASRAAQEGGMRKRNRKPDQPSFPSRVRIAQI